MALSEHLPLISNAPDGIQKLRGLILALAVRGKLTQQNIEDISAIQLVHKIRSDCAHKQSKLRKSKSNSTKEIASNEIPFSLPTNWQAVRNSELFTLRKGKVPKDLSEKEGLIPYLDIEALDRGNIRRYTNDSTAPASTKSDILVVCDGSRSGLLLHGADGAIGSTLAVIDTPAYIQPFVCLIFRESYQRLNSSMKGAAIPHLDTARLLTEVVGVPPLEEQQRIVAKVDELMSLCDQLEVEQDQSSAAYMQLVQTQFGTHTMSKYTTNFETSWKFISKNFDILFATESSIDLLQRTILQLAISGKLTKQLSTGQNALDLFNQLKTNRLSLVANGLCKKLKAIPTIELGTEPFTLPSNWAWVHLAEIVSHIGDGLHGTPVYTQGTPYHFVNGNNLVDGKILIKPDTKSVSKEEFLKHQKPLSERSILLSINGTLGKVAYYNDEQIVLGKSACYINLLPSLNKDYIRLVLSSPYFEKFAVTSSTGSTIKNLGLKSINDMPVPLPPLEEQSRIVAKVDELMTLCDQLKIQLGEGKVQESYLANALIQNALEAA